LIHKRFEDMKLEPKVHPVYEVTTLHGLVVRTQSGFYTVQTPEGLIISQAAGRLKEQKEDSPLTRDVVALGDYVTLERQADGAGFITEVQARRHVLSRVDPSSPVGTSAENEQIILANCDQAIFVLAAAQPAPQPRMLDRLLVVAEKAQLASIVIVLNKIDLLKDPGPLQAQMAPYLQMAYTLLYVSAKTGQGLEDLRGLMAGKVSVVTGPSGVGKSSLLNAAYPQLTLQTGHISQSTQKGKHTTRFSQLIPLEGQGGGYVADTPGIRAIAPWDVEPDELDSYYRDLRPWVSQCRFRDCMHLNDPGCAIRAAVEAGHISPARYESYVRLREELEAEYVYL
jgi:ribosome biogenesis GTPase